MAGTISVKQTQISGSVFSAKKITKTTVAFVGDATTGAIPAGSVALSGRVVKAVYIPTGSAHPTANTTLTLLDPESTIDLLNAAAKVTAGATAQEFYPVVAAGIAIQPLAQDTTYSVAITGNIIASATGTFEIFSEDAY